MNIDVGEEKSQNWITLLKAVSHEPWPSCPNPADLRPCPLSSSHTLNTKDRKNYPEQI